VNRTLVLGLIRQRLASPLRATIIGLVVVVPATIISALPGAGLAVLGDAIPIAMVFAVGMIGQDVSSGVLQLVLARPLKRWEYVISRWLGVAFGASAASLAQIGLAWAVMALRGFAPEPTAVALFAAGREIEIFGLAAAMALLSSLVGGFGDLALYVMLNIAGGALSLAGQIWRSAALQWVGEQLGAWITPRIDLVQIVSGTPSWFTIATYASNVSLSLLVAVLIMNRKELSYASG
jgi:hypothetical protein